MKKLFTLMALAFYCTVAAAQTEPAKDTIRIGNIIIIKQEGKNNDEKKTTAEVSIEKKHTGKPTNISTNWLILDLGFNNYVDNTNYNNAGAYLYTRPGTAPLEKSDFKLNTGKSINVNIWLFMQRLNLIKHYVHLKYGLGIELNNYRYKTSSTVSYLEQNKLVTPTTSAPIIFKDSISFSKNKLAADYVTVPLMLNFSTNKYSQRKGLSISLGVSAGYLYSQRNKQISKERGKEKNNGDYDLEQFKFSYIAELGLGPIHLYGSYTPKSIYQRQMDIRPYTFGIRLSNW
jgi:hypothetical protein